MRSATGVGTARRVAQAAVVALVVSSAPVAGALPALASPGRQGSHGIEIGAANTWVPTAAAMPVAAAHQTATLLRDGKVLIVGGTSATALLYNPATRTFAPTASMPAARPGATATLLPDGDVLVAGGCCHGDQNLASAELYDPHTGRWAATGSMAHGRAWATATLLPDGRVLVAGGACNGDDYGCDEGSSLVNQRSAELYDPATGRWTTTGSMLDGRDKATATLLHDGRVLVAGGFGSCDDDSCTDLAEAELYNAATGKWARTGSLHGAREQQTATLLADGQVLVAGGLNLGGFGSGGTYADAELYNPATGSWTMTASMAAARYDDTATRLRNGWVLVAGGKTASAQIYEPARKVWVTPGAMSTARTGQTATLLPDGHVLVAGGTGTNGEPMATAEVFLAGPGPLVYLTPTSLYFGSQQAGSTGAARSYTVANYGTAALTVSGAVVSGADPSDFLASTSCVKRKISPGASCPVSVRFGPRSTGLRSAQVDVADTAPASPQAVAVDGYGSGPDTFVPTGPMKVGRELATATLLPSGDVLVAGGEGGADNPLSEAELYDPATRSFTRTGSLHTARDWATATLLQDGNVLVAGGQGPNVANLSSAELYHPATGRWTVTGSMHSAGYALTSTLLPDGKVLVTGFGATAEVYDPAGGTWTDTGRMVSSQNFTTATMLPDGKVLVAAGVTAAAELYDPATNDWAATGSLHVARQGATATLLPDGNVLVAGGDPPGGGAALTSAELYHPSTGTWTRTGSMPAGRYGQTTTLLPGGQVILAGGCTGTCGPTLASTEYYSGGYWYQGPAMTMPRYDQSATVLADGDLLVTGGAVDSCCRVTATAEIYTPTIAAVSPARGPAGQRITVTGSGFYAGERVRVTLDDATALGTVTTSADGSFVLHARIPADAGRGRHVVRASGRTSGASASATFTVT